MKEELIKRAEKIVSILKTEYKDAKSALNYNSAFELLIAVILSAQCTDERVNIVTSKLFSKYKVPEDYLQAPSEELEKDIFSTGFYKQKAKSIKNCCEALIKNYNGAVPADFEELNKLPGVGRKTASVVVGNAFNIPAIAVDTHVKRLSNLLGFTKHNNPDKIEIDLKNIFNKKDWIILSHLLAAHGRKICIARSPKCELCVINDYCPSSKYI